MPPQETDQQEPYTDDNQTTATPLQPTTPVIDETPVTQAPDNPPSQGANTNGVNVGSSMTRFIFFDRIWLTVIIFVAAIGMAFIAPIFIYIGVILVFIYIGFMRDSFERTFLSEFASANGYDFSPTVDPLGQTGYMFFLGWGQRMENVVYGVYQGWPFFLFTYKYTTGSGRNQITHTRTIYQTNFNTVMPSFVLQRKEGRLERAITDDIHPGGNDTKLELEGDFNNYFNVLIKKDTQVDVLAILTPDLMQDLIPLDNYEIELTENGYLYIYIFKELSKSAELVDLFGALVKIINNVGATVDRDISLGSSTEAAINPVDTY